MAHKSIVLFVEGEPNSPNGNLRQGLSKLLEKKLQGKLPRIIMGEGKSQTIAKFKSSYKSNFYLKADLFLLLIDLDKSEKNIDLDLKENELSEYSENVFYMVQEMESWFLSQPEVLNSFYGKDNNGKLISEKLPKKNAIDFAHPDEILQDLTKNSKGGKYHKIKHAVQLLQRLDCAKLEKDFSEFKRLIERLTNF